MQIESCEACHGTGTIEWTDGAGTSERKCPMCGGSGVDPDAADDDLDAVTSEDESAFKVVESISEIELRSKQPRIASTKDRLLISLAFGLGFGLIYFAVMKVASPSVRDSGEQEVLNIVQFADALIFGFVAFFLRLIVFKKK